MSTFVQYHVIACYPPSKLNADDTGRPKTAIFGGAQRIRISSQCMKRAWRISDAFEEALRGYLGARTRKLGPDIRKKLTAEAAEGETLAKIDPKLVDKMVKSFDALFREDGKKDPTVFLGAAELRAIDEAIIEVRRTGKEPQNWPNFVLSAAHGSADVAMFGRMMATNPKFNVEAAVEVSHPITTHKAAVEDDYYTAVDDKASREDGEAASSFLDVQYFSSGVFYMYVRVNEDLLRQGIGDDDVAAAAMRALTKAIMTVSPSGKRASFASGVLVSYVMAERGAQTPRSLVSAFQAPVRGTDLLRDSIAALETTARKFDRAYGPLADYRYVFDVEAERGTMDGLIGFAAGDVSGAAEVASAAVPTAVREG